MKRVLNSITETAAVTWASQGIRVNGIGVDTGAIVPVDGGAGA
jgi:NAD(P)-dependent dehydrogenase (short-subunit alcohol dehydrogenase family)